MSELAKFPSWRYKERKYVEGETAKLVNNAEEEKALGEDWFDSPAKCPDREAEQAEIQRHYRERFEAADGKPNEQASILIEYRSQHPKEAAADSWYKEVAPLIPALQSQAMVNLAADRQAEDRKRRATETEGMKVAVVANATPRITSAGKPRDENIIERDHLIATLRESYKFKKGIGRNKKIAMSLDEQGEKPPVEWGVRTYLEATENRTASLAFNRRVAKAQFKKVPTT